MMKPKPYDDLISERMRENVEQFEKQHFKDLYEKEFNKVTDPLGMTDSVVGKRKPRPDVRKIDDEQIITHEFYTLFHEDSKNHENGITIEFHTLEDPFLSHKSPHQSATYEFVVRKTYPHVQYSQFMTKEQAVKLWKDLAGEREWSRGPNTEHKVRGKIALRLADGYDWKKHEGSIH